MIHILMHFIRGFIHCPVAERKHLQIALTGIAIFLSWTACQEKKDALPEQKYCLPCSSDSSFFYYTSDNDRIYLVVSDYCITIKFSSLVSSEYLHQLAEENMQLDSVTWIRESDYLAYGYLRAELSCEDIEALLVNLVLSDQVIGANPNFYLKETVDGGRPVNNYQDLLGLTNEFVVQPKVGLPGSAMESLLYATRTRLIRTGPFYLVLSADKNSVGNSLEMAQLFYETGYFEFSHPNFLMNPVMYK
jgi:hypothetical protein